MATSPTPKADRISLLDQLASVYKRQEALYSALSALIDEEVVFANYLVHNNNIYKYISFKDVSSQAIAKFRQRAAVILPQLAATHQEINQILEDLRVLH